MRWLITGGAGFIGSHVVDALVRRGHDEILVFDNFLRGRRQHLQDHLQNPALTIVEGDIRDEDALADACSDVDVVLHLAARSNVIGSEQHLKEACEINVTGTVNVLNAALKAGIRRLVFSSSREVYGDPQRLPVGEDAPLAPKNVYGASKLAGEVYCDVFRRRGLDIRTLRLGNVYGPRDSERVIPLWIERARLGLPLEVFGGRQILDLIWIDYVVQALLEAARLPALESPINVASGHGVPILELAERLINVTRSSSRIEFLAPREQEVVGFTADVTNLRKRLRIDPPADPLAYLETMAGKVPVSA
jgi:UDP-glucose 4-epimerase